MAAHSRPAQKWTVYRNGQLDPVLQVVRLEESLGGKRLDLCELVQDPKLAKPLENYQPLIEVGQFIDVIADGVGLKHSGFVSLVMPVFGPSGELMRIVSRAEHFMFGDPASGTLRAMPFSAATQTDGIRRQPAGNFRFTDDPIVFNPEIDGRVVGNRHGSITFGPASVPVFVDPEATKTEPGRSLQGGRAELWTLSQAVHYLCRTLNARAHSIYNPELPELTKVFRDSVDFVRNVEIQDGWYLPEALDALLNPLGYVWRIRRAGANFFDKFLNAIEFIRRGTGGDKVYLNHQRLGSIFDPTKTNTEASGVVFDASRLANVIEARGSKLQLEFTAELHKAWPESLDGSSIDSLTEEAVKLDNGATEGLPFAYRKWVLNEAGDYIDTRTEIKEYLTPQFHRNPLLEFTRWLVPKRRKLLPTITTGPDGSPIGSTRGIEIEYKDPAGDWQPIPKEASVEILQQEAGILFTDDKLPEWLIDRGASAQIRVTATIELDFRITAKAGPALDSPALPIEITATLDLDGQFHWRRRISKHGDDAPQDDRGALADFAEALRDRWDQIDVTGAVSLEGVDQHQYTLGDRVAGIRGKEVDFRANRRGDAFPQIAGITYDVERQKTILHLQRFRELIVG